MSNRKRNVRQAVARRLLNQLCIKNIPCNSDKQFKRIQNNFNAISIFNIQKQYFNNNLFSIALIYSCPNTQTSAFIDYLNYAVGSGIDVLLGDFNIDALDEVAYRKLKDTLISYNLKVLEPTHLDGALLDHVYLHKTFEHDKLVMSPVNNIYLSDHDAVTMQLRFKQNSDNDIDFNIRF